MSNETVPQERFDTLALSYYLFSCLFISIYGTIVCPFIDSLPPLQIIMPLTVFFAIQWMLRISLFNFILANRLESSQLQYRAIFEFSLFLITAEIATIYNMVQFNFPVLSGLKLMIGFITIGIFAATDITPCPFAATDITLVARRY